MTATPLRCHLLIGPPGSGKTTFARRLAPLLAGPDGQPGLVLSTDAIREELFGDAAVQGPWNEIRAVMLQRLEQAVANGVPVIVDATHARRPWRLLYTQVLELPRPVEWIGWWLTTPLDTCLAWARQRDRPVPEAVIREFHASIRHRFFGPDRAEGFATIVSLNPAAGEAEPETIRRSLQGLDLRIRAALNRQTRKDAQPHRYSRLLDLERLLFLLRLLTTHNGLEASDPATAAALEQICNPPPQGDPAERAAAYLASWKEVHGGNSDIYADVAAIRADLAWLESNGFLRLDWQGDPPIDPGPPVPAPGGGVHGGSPSLADPQVFRRIFTLLRHILKEPFDAPEGEEGPSEAGSPADRSAAGRTAAARARPKRARRDSSEFSPLYRHLIGRLADHEGSYAADQEASMRHDVEHLLRPYGFLPQVKGRPHGSRQGYAIGTALLSADQLLEVHAQLKASLDRLSDQSQKPLLHALEERLRRAGLLAEDGGAPGSRHPRRAVANRSFTQEKRGTLADPALSTRVERAIRDRRRLWLRHLPDAVGEDRRRRGDDGRFRAWPLQLLFHNISWYLAFETVVIGQPQGLIRVLRVDRLALFGEDGNARRGSEAEHDATMARLERLLHLCGGLFFGNDLDEQLALTRPDADPSAPPFEKLRFACTPQVFALIREEPNRFPPEHTSYGETVAGDSHPHPVELRLPHWTVHQDWDLRNWLFRWGAGVRIEQPSELREAHRRMAREVVGLYGEVGGGA